MARDRRAWQALARDHYENFPVGSWLLPAEARRHLHRIYAFARTADDIADEWQDPAALEGYRREFLDHVRDGSREISLFADLADSMRERDLPEELFTDLLDAFELDLRRRRHDEGSLLAYCRKSADPVGRLVLRACGIAEPELDRLSDRICTGLQLLNHLQDIREDLERRDRIYFPVEDLERFGVPETSLREDTADASVRRLVRHWCGRVAGLFEAGWPLTERVRGRLRYELRAILRGAAAVLRRIRRVDYDVLRGKVHLTRSERTRAVLAGLLSRRMPGFDAQTPRASERAGAEEATG